ncbi:hypothetical protein HAP47_0019720 [Bradyrhizobium sp. 41S5]|uniref:hypothetical protein n=1 Tax=Bradyrhizobium sp. 41S5 TaxID=1404443 RepID=UPI00156B89FB|nr:hypothetical protein [Bradyrhizobium sp. 41S5]UFX48765.1 hypothetical protein HAP47_0019720 [Bradyrhizobium sp. 41S5]
MFISISGRQRGILLGLDAIEIRNTALRKNFPSPFVPDQEPAARFGVGADAAASHIVDSDAR